MWRRASAARIYQTYDVDTRLGGHHNQPCPLAVGSVEVGEVEITAAHRSRRSLPFALWRGRPEEGCLHGKPQKPKNCATAACTVLGKTGKTPQGPSRSLVT